MALLTMTLNPNETIATSTDWDPSQFGATYQSMLNSDDGDTSYVVCDDNLEYIIIGFMDPPVPETDIEYIKGVRFLSSGRSTHRSNPANTIMEYAQPSGNPIQIASYDASRTTYETINGTDRPYSDGSSAAWTYKNLEDVAIRCTKSLSTEVRLSYLAMEVTYKPAENATFFGANF